MSFRRDKKDGKSGNYDTAQSMGVHCGTALFKPGIHCGAGGDMYHIIHDTEEKERRGRSAHDDLFRIALLLSVNCVLQYCGNALAESAP